MSTNAASTDSISISNIDGRGVGVDEVAEATTGSHVLQIKGYSLTKGLANREFIDSSIFCLGGHQWFIRYFPDGDRVESAAWVSLFLHLESTDAVDVKARFKFSVVDDTGESVPTMSKKSSITFSSNIPSSGFPQFVTRKALEESPYLRDDCLRVRCDIILPNGISPVPPSNLHLHLGSLLSSGVAWADVNFEVAGELFAAHRIVLAARSSVFMGELFGHMKEKEKAQKCITIQDMEARVFKAMLHFIYTDTMPEIDEEDVFVVTQNLLVAADRYDLKRLKLICEQRLCMCVDKSTVVTALVFAEWHGCQGLKNACFLLLKSSPSLLNAVMATESFDHLMTTYPSLIKEMVSKMATLP